MTRTREEILAHALALISRDGNYCPDFVDHKKSSYYDRLCSRNCKSCWLEYARIIEREENDNGKTD